MYTVILYATLHKAHKVHISKRHCFILAHNIRMKVGTHSVNLPKPLALMGPRNITFPTVLTCASSLL